jgi:hypothetical protein
MEPHVFISYARADEAHARHLANDLRQQGLSVWLDVEEGLLPGDRWEEEIAAALYNSSYCVVLLSQNSLARNSYVKQETQIAYATASRLYKGDRFLLPARISPVTPRDEPLSGLHHVDLFPDWDAGVQRLVGAMADRRPASMRTPFRYMALGAATFLIPLYLALLPPVLSDPEEPGLGKALFVVLGAVLPTLMLGLGAAIFAAYASNRVRSKRGAFAAGFGTALLMFLFIYLVQMI